MDLHSKIVDRAPLGQFFKFFMQFSGKFGQIIGWGPSFASSLENPGSATDFIFIFRSTETKFTLKYFTLGVKIKTEDKLK